MYVCKPGLFMRVGCWLIMLAVVPEIFFCLYMLTKCQFDERTFYLGGALIFGALFLMLFWRLVVLGASWLEYDDEKVVFHLSRDDEQTVPWSELPSELVKVKADNGTLVFTFLPGEEYNKKAAMQVNFMFSGYRDFKRECERRRVIFNFGKAECEQIFNQLFGDEQTLKEILDYAEKADENKK